MSSSFVYLQIVTLSFTKLSEIVAMQVHTQVPVIKPDLDLNLDPLSHPPI